jgi:hypothetical protein
MVDEINEKSLSGAQRYYMHSQAHDQAAKKYAISAKSVDPEQAKVHRKLGRFHKTISAALSQIAGVHTSNDFNRAMKKKAENMANKKVNENVDDLGESKIADETHKLFKSDSTSKDHIRYEKLGHTSGSKHILSAPHHGALHTNTPDFNKKFKEHVLKHGGEYGRSGGIIRDEDGKHFFDAQHGTHHSVYTYRHIKEDVTEDMDMDYEDLDEEYIEEEALTEHVDMLNALYDNEPGAFSSAFASLMQRKALDRIEEIKIDIAQATFDDEDIQEDVEQVDEISGKTLGSYIQKARVDAEKKRVHYNDMKNHPSVKKFSDERRDYYNRREYNKYGESKHRAKIEKTYDKEAKAMDKLDPNHRKTTAFGKRQRGVEKALKKLETGKLTD